jgi:uncharacterized membrane protein YdjX (TVP38/TMEM64 family)
MRSSLKIIFMLLIPLSLGILWVVPSSRHWLLQMIEIFSTVDPQEVANYIRSFGAWSVVISFSLMVFQSLAAPLPAFLITFANAAVYGWIWGAVLSWTSAMVGAALCFGLARLYGRNLVVKLTGQKALQAADQFFAKSGAYTILIARLLPFMPFDIVSYAAGLTSMRLRVFLLATGLGQLPATLIYSYAGEMLVGGARTFVFGLLLIFALVALVALLRSWVRK